MDLNDFLQFFLGEKSYRCSFREGMRALQYLNGCPVCFMVMLLVQVISDDNLTRADSTQGLSHHSALSGSSIRTHHRSGEIPLPLPAQSP
jgi:hypothetical protein